MALKDNWNPLKPAGDNRICDSDNSLSANFQALGDILGGTTATAGGVTFGSCHHFVPISTSDRDTYISIMNGKNIYNSTDGKPQVIVKGEWLNYITSFPDEVQGNILFRNATGWVTLAPGTTDCFLQTKGASQNPVWADIIHALGGVKHSPDSLANLNSKISDAELDDKNEKRHPFSHAIGGVSHAASTLSELNNKVTDATLDDINDPRTPKAHYLDSHQDFEPITEEQGQIIYHSGVSWVALNPGTDGYFLKTQGSGANPLWDVGGSVDRLVLSPSGAIRGARGVTDAPELRLTDGEHSWVGLMFNKDYGEKVFWHRSVFPAFGGVNLNIKVFVISGVTVGNMKWEILTTSAGSGDLWNTALGVTGSVVMPAPGIAGSVGVTLIGITSPWAVDEIALIGISRLATDGEDTMDADAELLWVEVKVA